MNEEEQYLIAISEDLREGNEESEVLYQQNHERLVEWNYNSENFEV